MTRAVDPQYTVDPESKPDPLTVSVKAELPAVTNAGEILLMTGAGLIRTLTINVTEAVADV